MGEHKREKKMVKMHQGKPFNEKIRHKIITPKQIYDYVECGSCGQYHRATYWGDCRNDEERFNLEDIPKDALICDLEEQMEMEGEVVR